MRHWLLLAYIGATWLLAVATMAAGLLLSQPRLEWAWWGALLLLGAALAGEVGAVPIASPHRRRDRPYIASIASIPHISAALLLPAWAAAGLAGAGILLNALPELRSGKRVLFNVFNVASRSASVGLAALAAGQLGLQGAGLGNGDWSEVASFLLVAALYCATHSLLGAGVSAIATRHAFWSVLWTNARSTAPAELAISVLGGLAAFIWVKNPFWVPIAVCPALISQLTFRYIAASTRKTTQLAALDRLGRALSAGVTPNEIFRAASAQLRGTRSVEGAF